MRLTLCDIFVFSRVMILTLFATLVSCSADSCLLIPQGEGQETSTATTERASSPWRVVRGKRLLPEEIRFREAWESARFALTGHIVDEGGIPLSGARVSLNKSTLIAQSNDEGEFMFPSLSGGGGELHVELEGYYSFNAAYAVDALDTLELKLDTIVLEKRNPDSMKGLFAGDFMLGRRFLEGAPSRPDVFPLDDEESLILASNPSDGASAVVAHMLEIFNEADFHSLNFESVATRAPETPHPSKDFVYFTLPASLTALSHLNIDYVSLGNNHTYDYLEQGLEDTFNALDSFGLKYSGAGLNNVESWAPARLSFEGIEFGIASANSIAGNQHEVTYNASSTKGGAADLNDSVLMAEVLGALRSEERFTILQAHTGSEYSRHPGDFQRAVFEEAANSGANLIIGHHPHAPQGFGLSGDTLVAHSLGNFVFDSQRHETFVGIVAGVTWGSQTWHHASALPIFIEDFKPKLSAGDLLDVSLRRIIHYSDRAGLKLIADGYRLRIYREGDAAAEGWTISERSVDVPLIRAFDGERYLDLRQVRQKGEWLSGLDTRCESPNLGTDILLYGDFEDVDGDLDTNEMTYWLQDSQNVYPCGFMTRRGLSALCMVATTNQEDDTVSSFRPRLRAYDFTEDTPNLDITLLGYAAGRIDSEVHFEVETRGAEGSKRFGIVNAMSWNSQTLPEDLSSSESVFAVSPQFAFSLGENPRRDDLRAFKLRLRALPASTQDSYFVLDDLAFVTWLDEDADETISHPHDRDFVRCSGAELSEETLAVTMSHYVFSAP